MYLSFANVFARSDVFLSITNFIDLLIDVFQSMTMSCLADIHVDLNIPVPDPILFANNASGDEVSLLKER